MSGEEGNRPTTQYSVDEQSDLRRALSPEPQRGKLLGKKAPQVMPHDFTRSNFLAKSD